MYKKKRKKKAERKRKISIRVSLKIRSLFSLFVQPWYIFMEISYYDLFISPAPSHRVPCCYKSLSSTCTEYLPCERGYPGPRESRFHRYGEKARSRERGKKRGRGTWKCEFRVDQEAPSLGARSPIRSRLKFIQRRVPETRRVEFAVNLEAIVNRTVQLTVAVHRAPC